MGNCLHRKSAVNINFSPSGIGQIDEKCVKFGETIKGVSINPRIYQTRTKI